jgi:hypothetical protein
MNKPGVQFRMVGAVSRPRDCGFEHVCFGCNTRIACPCEVHPGRETVFVTVAFCPPCAIEKGVAPARVASGVSHLRLVKD